MPPDREDQARLAWAQTTPFEEGQDVSPAAPERPDLPPRVPAPTKEPEAHLIGQRIGGYRIVRKLGHGGMGVVYEAVHEQLRQRAAVKTLKLELSYNPSFTQRFLIEARAAATVQHPGLVKVFDFGQLPDRTLYILMEFLEGQPLDQRLGGRPLDEPTALRMARQIASTVQAAHACGILHRDLKPGNLFVVADPEAPAGERIKILDFGLAKITEESASSGGICTTTGTILGTPVYMSPEQCRGLASTTDKTDVYSLGVILFEMLAGSPPFIAATTGDLIAMHIGNSPPPLRRKAPGVSATVAELVSDMLGKTPATRPSMAQVVERLQQAATEPPPPAAPRAVWTLGGGALLAGMAVLGAWRTVDVQRHKGAQQKQLARPAAPQVVWALSSEPAGAEIVRLADQTHLGRTPWRREQGLAPGAVNLMLLHAGYASQEIVLNGSASSTRHVVLVPLNAAAPPAQQPPATGPAQAPSSPVVKRSHSKYRRISAPESAGKSVPASLPSRAETADKAAPAGGEPPAEDVDVPPLR